MPFIEGILQDRKENVMRNGTRVRVIEIRADAEFFRADNRYTKLGAAGVVVESVRQYGGDVVEVRHDDGAWCQYDVEELTTL